MPGDAGAAEFGRALVREAERRLIGEGLRRIEICFSKLDEEEIWRRPNDQTVSIGNLVLHLCGNVRQYFVSALGGAPDIRERSKEFTETGPIPKQQLLDKLRATLEEARDALDRVDPASLLELRHVQGGRETGLSIIVHVVEHFSYHVGEITYALKSQKAVDTGYYAGQDLEKRN